MSLPAASPLFDDFHSNSLSPSPQLSGAGPLSADTLNANPLGTNSQSLAADTFALPDAGSLLTPGYELTLRPMRYPVFYEMYRDAIKNTWTVDEVDFSDDFDDLRRKLLPVERHLINRLVAFFATGDTICLLYTSPSPRD